MSGTRLAVGRTVALGLLLALSVLLLAAAKAEAGKYAVAQCGWYVGADASWGDTTGGAKFRPDAFCVPTGGDPFAGVHVKSLTRDGQGTVSGTRFARWRWTAPAGTGITAVRGTWWHALHDGIEQRLGSVNGGGGFEPFLSAATTDTALREFSKGFPSPVPGFEDRLLCARAESKWCSLEQGSWSSLRGADDHGRGPDAPNARIGGDLLAGGWRRGVQSVAVGRLDAGAGVRFGETMLDGARVGSHRVPLREGAGRRRVAGDADAAVSRRCLGPSRSPPPASATARTRRSHCATDFAGNRRCTPRARS